MASREREKDYYRYSPVHLAVMTRRAAMVRCLVKIMHDGMREKDEYGNMPGPICTSEGKEPDNDHGQTPL
jgi:hypothetical protein